MADPTKGATAVPGGWCSLRNELNRWIFPRGRLHLQTSSIKIILLAHSYTTTKIYGKYIQVKSRSFSVLT
jgi:hypothetical protein